MKLKSKARSIVMEMIEREREHLNGCEVGTEEYNDSQKRLIALEEKLAELDRIDIESKDRFWKFIVEAIKVVGCGIALPVIGLVAITAQERDITYTGAMKALLSSFIPGKKL